MNKLFKTALFVLGVPISMIGQENKTKPNEWKHDLVLSVSESALDDFDYSKRVKLEWIKNSPKNWNLKTGLIAYNSYNTFNSSWAIYNESVVRNDFYLHDNAGIQGSFGIIKNLGENDLFSIGGSILAGYNNRYTGITTSSERWSEEHNTWGPVKYDYDNNEIPEESTTEGFYSKFIYEEQLQFITGLELNFGINTRLSKRFVVGTTFSPQYIISVNMKENRFDPQQEMFTLPHFQQIIGFLDFSLKYQFGKSTKTS